MSEFADLEKVEFTDVPSGWNGDAFFPALVYLMIHGND